MTLDHTLCLGLMELTYRPRRLRRTPALRAMVREHSLSAADFIYPLFVHEGAEVEPIAAMPGASRWSLRPSPAKCSVPTTLGCVASFSSPRCLRD